MYLTHTHKYLTHTHKYLTHTHNTHNVHSRAKKLANKEGKKLYAQVDRVPEEEAMAIEQVCRYTCVCVLMCVCQILMYVCQILMYVCQILMYVLSRFLSLFLYRASLFFLILSLDLSYTGVCVYVYVGTRVCVCMYVSVVCVRVCRYTFVCVYVCIGCFRRGVGFSHNWTLARSQLCVYRAAKTHRMPKVAGHFSQKSHQFQGSFTENDP